MNYSALLGICVLAVLMTTFAYIIRERKNQSIERPSITNHITRVEGVEPVQLTTDEMLYVLNGTSRSAINFERYLQFVRGHVVKPSESRQPTFLPLDGVCNILCLLHKRSILLME